MMEYVRRGDTVIVESISRFARNTRDLLELLEKLSAKGVEFVSKKEAIDTTTPTGKFMLTVFGAVGGTGTGIYPPTPAGGHRHCQAQRRLQRAQAYSTAGA